MIVFERCADGSWVVSNTRDLHYGVGSTRLAALIDYVKSRLEYAVMNARRHCSKWTKMDRGCNGS